MKEMFVSPDIFTEMFGEYADFEKGEIAYLDEDMKVPVLIRPW